MFHVETMSRGETCERRVHFGRKYICPDYRNVPIIGVVL